MTTGRSAPRSVQEMVDHQVRRWQVERRASVPRPGAPCVAISRLPGSGAEELGRKVAEWLDYGFFGIEIVDQIAREQKIQRDLIDGVDERVRDTIQRYVIDSFRSRDFTESDYLRQVVHTITTLGERGMAVVLGRGAPYVLPAGQSLRVFVVAPREMRLERLAKRLEVSRAEAERRLLHEETQRREFLHQNFKVDPDDPSLYDLVVNMEYLDRESAGRVIVEALRRRFPVAP